jgi:hypothetical protein
MRFLFRSIKTKNSHGALAFREAQSSFSSCRVFFVPHQAVPENYKPGKTQTNKTERNLGAFLIFDAKQPNSMNFPLHTRAIYFRVSGTREKFIGKFLFLLHSTSYMLPDIFFFSSSVVVLVIIIIVIVSLLCTKYSTTVSARAHDEAAGSVSWGDKKSNLCAL